MLQSVGADATACFETTLTSVQRSAADQPWQYFYSEIEGFTHEPGFDYELRVREEKVANPPADGSSLRRTLVRVVSKRAAASAPAP